MHGGGIHLIDLLLWFKRMKVVNVSAMSTKIATSNAHFKYPDTISATLEFEDSSIAVVTSNYPAVIPHGHRLALYGTKGTFHHGPLGAAYFWDRDSQSTPEYICDPYPGSSKGAIIPSFVDHIIDRSQQPVVTSGDVFNAMSVSLSIEKSLQLHKPTSVNYLS